VVAVYKDAATFSSDKHEEFAPKYGDSPLYAHHTTSLVFNDPPLHTRVRRLIAGALTPRHIAAMEARLVDRVDRLLDAMEARGSGAEIDLIAAFASAIPVEIIGNLLDVPAEERAPLRDWSLAILGALEPTLSEAQLELGNRAVREFLLYLEGLVERRRAAPGDPEVDVLSRLIAHAGDARHRLGQSRPRDLRRARPARCRAHAEPTRRVRLGHPPMRRHGTGAARRARRDRPLPRPLSALPARRAGAARTARALSR